MGVRGVSGCVMDEWVGVRGAIAPVIAAKLNTNYRKSPKLNSYL